MMHYALSVLAMAGTAVFASAADQPILLLPIGDSLTEEYRFMTPFSAPASDPQTPNTRNWVEILADHRPEEVSFGSYNSTFAHYGDFRNTGFRYNYGIPGFTTTDWLAVLNANPLDFSPIGMLRTFTRNSLTDLLGNADVALVFVGGNDLRANYSAIFNDDDASALLDGVVTRLGAIHDWVRGREPDLPILIATVPDIGATPDFGDRPAFADPVLRARARARIAAMNEQIMAMAATLHAPVIRIDHLTNAVFDAAPFHLNGTVFSMVPDPENPPLHAFTRDGFHPSTVGHALIANEVLLTLGLEAIPNREILSAILGLDPDQPFHDWAEDALPLPAGVEGATAGIPNLARYLFDLPGDDLTRPLAWKDGGFVSPAPRADRLRFAGFTVEESATVDGQWQTTPDERLVHRHDGAVEIIHPEAAADFFRLRIAPRP